MFLLHFSDLKLAPRPTRRAGELQIQHTRVGTVLAESENAQPMAPASRAMKAAPRSSWASSRYSSGWCACSIEPGRRSPSRSPPPGTAPPRRRRRPPGPGRCPPPGAARGRSAAPSASGPMGGVLERASTRTPASGARAFRAASSAADCVKNGCRMVRGSIPGGTRRSNRKTHSRANMFTAVPPFTWPMVRLAPFGRKGEVGSAPRSRSAASCCRVLHQGDGLHHRRDAEMGQAGVGLVAVDGHPEGGDALVSGDRLHVGRLADDHHGRPRAGARQFGDQAGRAEAADLLVIGEGELDRRRLPPGGGEIRRGGEAPGRGSPSCPPSRGHRAARPARRP